MDFPIQIATIRMGVSIISKICTSDSEYCIYQTLMKCSSMLHFICVFTVCKTARLGVFSIQRFNSPLSDEFDHIMHLVPKVARPLGHTSCIKRILGECLLISSLPGKALRTLVDIARLAERFNMRSQSRAW